MIHCLVLAQECDCLVECPEQVPEEIPMPFGVPEVSEVLPEHVCQNWTELNRTGTGGIDWTCLQWRIHCKAKLPSRCRTNRLVFILWNYSIQPSKTAILAGHRLYHLDPSGVLFVSLYHLFLWVLHSWFWSRPWGFEVQTPVLGQSRNGWCPLACADCATAQPALLCVRRCPASKSNRWTRIGKAKKNDRKTAFFRWIYILLWLHKAPGTIASSLRASVGSSFLTELLLTWVFRLYLPSTRNINDIKGSKCLGSSYKMLQDSMNPFQTVFWGLHKFWRIPKWISIADQRPSGPATRIHKCQIQHRSKELPSTMK